MIQPDATTHNKTGRLGKREPAHRYMQNMPDHDRLTMRINALKPLNLILSLPEGEAKTPRLFRALLET